MNASTGLRSDLMRLADLYGMPGKRISKIEADTEGATFTWISPGTAPFESWPVRESRLLPLGANPPGQTDMDTPIYDQLLRENEG